MVGVHSVGPEAELLPALVWGSRAGPWRDSSCEKWCKIGGILQHAKKRKLGRSQGLDPAE